MKTMWTAGTVDCDGTTFGGVRAASSSNLYKITTGLGKTTFGLDGCRIEKRAIPHDGAVVIMLPRPPSLNPEQQQERIANALERLADYMDHKLSGSRGK